MISYFHCRIESPGVVNIYERKSEKNKNPKSVMSKGGYTLAGISSLEKFVEGIRWGVAKCHEKDNYNKRIGRIKAEGKAKSHLYSFNTIMLADKQQCFFAKNLSQYLENFGQSVPTPEMIEQSMQMAMKTVSIPASSEETLLD